MKSDEQVEDFPEETLETEDRYPQVAAPRGFHFSLKRLLVAFAVAPLPWVLFSVNDSFIAGLFALCGLGLVGIIFLIRAEDLPRINLGVAVMLGLATAATCLTGTFSFAGIAFWSVITALPGFLYAHGQFPSYEIHQGRKQLKPAPRCESVWTTGSFLYVGLNVIAWKWCQRSVEEDGLRWPAIVLAAVFVQLLLVNVRWILLEKGERLDERPELGFYYELTLIGIPLATLCILMKELY